MGNNTNNLSSSLPQHVLAELLGVKSDALEKSSYLMVFLKVAGQLDCEVLFNASNTGSFFRLVNQSRVAGEDETITHLIVEYNLDHARASDPEFLEHAAYGAELKDFVEEYGLGEARILESVAVPLENKIVYPKSCNVARTLENTKRLDGIEISLMGPSIGMNGGALNDQIVQALQYVEARV